MLVEGDAIPPSVCFSSLWPRCKHLPQLFEVFIDLYSENMRWTLNQLCCQAAEFVIDNSKGHTIISAYKSLTCSSDVNINTVINVVTLPQVIDLH